MRVEVVAIGTELLLGQIVDTNSSWIGQRLAASGLDSHFQTKVGDNHDRIVSALRIALERSDAVICCGGLGPTQDDITRDAIAEVMGVPLIRHPEIVERIRAMFVARGRVMAENNALQADVPQGASIIEQTKGTAPGLICSIGDRVMYAVPGVPHEMTDMMERAIVPDLIRRSGTTSVIESRVLRTWGVAESTLAELVAPRLDALNLPGAAPATIAFLASGMEGIKVRVTAKAASHNEVVAVLDGQERALRDILGALVFGTDDETMEVTIGNLLVGSSETLAVAESVTGGLIASRIVGVPGASRWFRGGIVSYASEVKFDLLNVPVGPVVGEAAAIAMAVGVAARLRADIGLSVTGVAGPDTQDGESVGTVFVGIARGETQFAVKLFLPGDRERIRQYATISALNEIRKLFVS
jgi:nicotinamide-nucleotide amidase